MPYGLFVSPDDEFQIPLWEHIADICLRGRVTKEDVRNEVESALHDVNVSPKEVERAVEVCLRAMRRERLIKR